MIRQAPKVWEAGRRSRPRRSGAGSRAPARGDPGSRPRRSRPTRGRRAGSRCPWRRRPGARARGSSREKAPVTRSARACAIAELGARRNAQGSSSQPRQRPPGGRVERASRHAEDGEQRVRRVERARGQELDRAERAHAHPFGVAAEQRHQPMLIGEVAVRRSRASSVRQQRLTRGPRRGKLRRTPRSTSASVTADREAVQEVRLVGPVVGPAHGSPPPPLPGPRWPPARKRRGRASREARRRERHCEARCRRRARRWPPTRSRTLGAARRGEWPAVLGVPGACGIRASRGVALELAAARHPQKPQQLALADLAPRARCLRERARATRLKTATPEAARTGSPRRRSRRSAGASRAARARPAVTSASSSARRGFESSAIDAPWSAALPTFTMRVAGQVGHEADAAGGGHVEVAREAAREVEPIDPLERNAVGLGQRRGRPRRSRPWPGPAR